MKQNRRHSPRKGRYSGLGERVLPAMVQAFLPALPVALHDDGRKIYGALLARQYDRAVCLADSILEQQYPDAYSTWAASQLANLVRKVPFKHPGLDPEGTAIRKFWKAEHSCMRINQRFRAMAACGREPYSEYLALAREYIRQVLGDVPPLGEIYERCNFGPGASNGVHGDMTSFVQKVGTLTVTPACASYAREAIWSHAQLRELFLVRAPSSRIACLDKEHFLAEVEKQLIYVRANKITFVPKTAKTHRSIAMEPTLNGFVQKGIDEVMRALLKRRARLDLQDQETNQVLALHGSLEGPNPWSTIDLSAASDSLSIEVVRALLPYEWFKLLNAVRSPEFEIPGEDGSHVFHKFTSMGNGFCFPLETLIFASLAYAANAHSREPSRTERELAARIAECNDVVVKRDLRKQLRRVSYDNDRFAFRVYGDDIIVRQRVALLLIELLRFVGFRTNTDKTFVFGPFRESCGADYFGGHNVRPLVLDEIPRDARSLFKILNGLRTTTIGCVTEMWHAVRDFVHQDDVLLRPVDGPPDSAITVPLDVFMASDCGRWSRRLQAWQWRELLAIPIDEDVPEHLALYGALAGCTSGDAFLPRVAYRRKTRTVTRWVACDADSHNVRAIRLAWGIAT